MTDWTDSRIAAIEVTPMWAGSLDMGLVDSALKDAGVPEDLIPSAPSRAVCMRRAFEASAPPRAKIDPLPKGMGVAMSLKDVTMLDLEALALQQGHEVRQAASYNTTLSCKILVVNQDGAETETRTYTPSDHPMIPVLEQSYEIERGKYKASEDLSVWFSQTIVPFLAGVSKRSRGGVYYVPSHKRDLLLKIAGAFQKLSASDVVVRHVNGVEMPVHILTHGGKLCLEPRYSDDSAAMEIMVDGVIRETDAHLDDLVSAVTDSKRQLGKRALATKKEQLETLRASMKSWEDVCSVSLSLLQDRITEAEKTIALAEIQVQTSSD